MLDVVATKIEDRIVELFADKTLAGYEIGWEKVDKYAIDNASRKTLAAIGIVDQGAKYAWKTSVCEVTWKLAVEFFIRCQSTEDIKAKTNLARAEMFRRMVTTIEFDEVIMGLVDDIKPLMDQVYVNRMDHQSEGVMIFDLKYRTKSDDIGSSV